MMMRLLFILCLTLSHSVFAQQQYKGSASIPPVQTTGFYRIALSPVISHHLNEDYGNLRILNNKSQEVPYLLTIEQPVQFSRIFKEYQILEKKQEKKCCTSLLLHNPNDNPINNIILSIKNAEVTKQATLLGSDNKEDWFALKENFWINSIKSQNQTSEVKIVDFPLSNYKYYLLQLNDSSSAPINILKAGYFEATYGEGNYTEVGIQKTKLVDSAEVKKTFIHITFDTLQLIDRLEFSMTGAPYFLRYATLSTKNTRLNRKGKPEFYIEQLAVFEVSSKQKTILELPATRTEDLIIAIENNDNPPLSIKEIKAFQLNRYVTAWLETGNQYTLGFGSTEMNKPNYDLVFFKDSIPATPQTLAHGSFELTKTQPTESFTLFTNKKILWVAIVIIILALGIMSYRMIQDTSKKRDN
jgi:hypothetical protein